VAGEGQRDPLAELVAAAERGDEAETLEAARRAYRAYLRGEVGLESEAVDPEIQWEPPGHSLTAGEYRGPSAAEREVRAWREPFEDFSWEPKEVILGEDRFIVVGDMRARGRGSGAEVEAEELHVWALREGRIVRMQMFHDRAEALLAAGIASRGSVRSPSRPA
jgi:ketosteroid isomerase-like protein